MNIKKLIRILGFITIPFFMVALVTVTIGTLWNISESNILYDISRISTLCMVIFGCFWLIIVIYESTKD